MVTRRTSWYRQRLYGRPTVQRHEIENRFSVRYNDRGWYVYDRFTEQAHDALDYDAAVDLQRCLVVNNGLA